MLLFILVFFFFFFKQKTAYEMRISDWSSDVCSSDLPERHRPETRPVLEIGGQHQHEIDRIEEDEPQRDVWRHRPGEMVARRRRREADRKSVVVGKSGSGRVDHGGRRTLKKKTVETSTPECIGLETVESEKQNC